METKRQKTISDEANTAAANLPFSKTPQGSASYQISLFCERNAAVVDAIYAKGLPVILAFDHMAKTGKQKRPSVFLARDILPTIERKMEWGRLKPSDIEKPFFGYHLQSLEFFVSKKPEIPAESIGQPIDAFTQSDSKKDFLNSILIINGATYNRQIASSAALFFSGILVRQDKVYAQSILDTISKEEKSQALSDSLIMSCCNSEKIDFTRIFLEMGAEPEKTDEVGYSPAYWAFARGNFAAVELLIKFGASVTRPHGDLSDSIWDELNNRDLYSPSIEKLDVYQLAQGRLSEEKSNANATATSGPESSSNISGDVPE